MPPLHAPRFSAANAASVMNSFANRCLIPLLRGSAGGWLGRGLAVVEYDGRRTGRHHQLVTMYAAVGPTVRITVGMAEQKSWWRNFETPRPLQLRLAGVDRDAVGQVVREGERVTVVAELTPSPARPAPSGPANRERSV